MSKTRVLVIEDDPAGRRSVTEAIQEAGHAVTAAATGRDGLKSFQEQVFDAVLCDLILPDTDGMKVLAELRKINSDVPVVIITAYGSVSSAVGAIKAGAYDYILKPLDLDDIQSRVARAVETRRMRSELIRLRETVHGRCSARSIVAKSAQMREVLDQVASVAATNATVLVLGESGTGKELVARALHFDGKRANGPFVAVSCAALSESLLESELFGHEKGAFTGASARRLGAFERADEGTLFLDEIGSAPHSVQARLLRALEEKEITRLGGEQSVSVDSRIVSASNRDLDRLVRDGAFRHDLLYRLQVVTIRIPPLRERPEDIRPLIDHFVAAAGTEHGRRIDRVEEDYYRAMEQREWPGNVRELRNAVESSVVMATGPILGAADASRAGVSAPETRLAIPEDMSLADIEKEALLRALRRHNGNRTLAAKALGVATRTVQRKIKEYGLPF